MQAIWLTVKSYNKSFSAVCHRSKRWIQRADNQRHVTEVL